MKIPAPASHLPGRSQQAAEDNSVVAAERWQERLQNARQARLSGDLLIWADEAQLPVVAVQARRLAGQLLLDEGQPEAALAQFEQAAQLDADDRESRDLATICRQRIETGAEPATSRPKQVLLFSGHRIDEPGRAQPRFTPVMLPAAMRRLNQELDELQAGHDDLALCQAAAGGDLLFLEACLSRGVRCQVLLPFDEATFIDRSILASLDGQSWLDRWLAIRPALREWLREMPCSLGTEPAGSNPYQRANQWLLNTALAHGAQKLRLLCLWDGMAGDGPGGVAHMMEEVRRRAGVVRWLDTRRLS